MSYPHRTPEALRLALIPAVLALLLVACGGSAPPPSAPAMASPSPTAPPLPTTSASPEPTVSAPPQPGSQEVTPSSPPKDVGAIEVLTVFTHCGFEGRLDWAGSFWRETGREPDGGPIGDPEDTGRITLIDATTARFESSTGTVVVLERVEGAVTVQPCD